MLLARNHTSMSALEKSEKRMVVHRLPISHLDPQAPEIMLAATARATVRPTT